MQGTHFTLTNVRVTPLRIAITGADGRDEISLLAEGTDRKFPRKTEQQLTQLPVSRALALPH